jgi:hypothetical protein
MWAVYQRDLQITARVPQSLLLDAFARRREFVPLGEVDDTSPLGDLILVRL